MVRFNISTQIMISRLNIYVLFIFLLVACSRGPEADLAITDARVITGTGEVLETGTVLIKDNKIHSVEETGAEISAARQINADGKTVLPGLIDAHVHITVPPDEKDSTALARHMEENVPGILQDFLEHGVTTLRSTGGYWPSVGRLRDRLAAGELHGPRMVTSGPNFTTEGGHPAASVCTGEMGAVNPDQADPFCRSHLAREVGSVEDARQAVQRLANQGVDFIKLAFNQMGGTGPLMEPEVMEAIADQAHQEGLKAVGHVFEARFMESGVRAGLDGFVHPPTIVRPLPDDRARQLAELLAAEATPVTTTRTPPMFFMDAPGEFLRNQLSDSGDRASHTQDLAIFAEAGVPVVVGSDWCACFPNALEDPPPAVRAGTGTITEMKLLASGGLSQHEVIRAATSNAARALEMGDEVGTLEAGKVADLIVVDGNPLEDLSALENVETVIKDGEIIDESGNADRRQL